LEHKPGIAPVIVKPGPRKDWPSPFKEFTAEQREYIEDKLINPAYERFVRLVAESRPGLSPEDAARLADGSIYGADEALGENLIDGVGYMDEAVSRVLSLAGIEKAQVVEYRKPFSLSELLRSRSGFSPVDRNTLYELATPQLMYLWTGQ
jgi:protease-4